jgi:iron complex transport system permease protein
VLAGPVAFVGFVSPHLARLLVGPLHRPLLLAAAPIGAALILIADTASVLVDASSNAGRMPIGIFTAIAGGIVFVWMLRRHSRAGAIGP